MVDRAIASRSARSAERTPTIAQELGVKILSAPRSRAIQMNAGAAAATGEILLFLHADTRLPPQFDEMVVSALLVPGTIAGAFALHIDAPIKSLRLVEVGVNWRSRIMQMPYGDQAIFINKEVFHQIGGFPELPFMEDFEVMRRLRPMGRIAIIPQPVITSARRWQKKGVYKTTLMNQIAIVAYLLGVPPKQILHWYREG